MAAIFLGLQPFGTCRSNQLGRVLLRFISGAQLTEDALASFASVGRLPTGEELRDVNGKDHEFLAQFDAHVGDTACHLRAQMVWELVRAYTTPEERDWLEETRKQVQLVRKNAVDLLAEIARVKGNFRKLGFAPTFDFGDLASRVGYYDFVDCLAKPTRASTPTSDDSLDYSSDGAFSSSSSSYSGNSRQSSTCPSPLFSPIAGSVVVDNPITQLSLRQLEDETSPSSAPSATSKSSKSSRNGHRRVDADAWNPSDRWFVVRFLTFSRATSLHKEMTVETHLEGSWIQCRLDPQSLPGKVLARLDSTQGLLPKGKKISDLLSKTDVTNRVGLLKEQEAIQVYLASVTASWMQASVRVGGLPNSVARVVEESSRLSERKVVCIPAYPSILPLRHAWLVQQTPIFLFVRRFCDHGYHNLFFRVRASDQSLDNYRKCVEHDAVGAITSDGSPDWFDVTPVTATEVEKESFGGEPHIVLIANSVDGAMARFYERLGRGPSDAAGCLHDGSCEDAEAKSAEVLNTNFALMLQHALAGHKQYPFALPGDAVGEDAVANIVGDNLGECAKADFLRHAKNATAFGTSESASRYSPQHFFVELPILVVREAARTASLGPMSVSFGFDGAQGSGARK